MTVGPYMRMTPMTCFHLLFDIIKNKMKRVLGFHWPCECTGVLGILFPDVECPRILRRITGEELLGHTTEVAQIEQNSQSIKVRVSL